MSERMHATKAVRAQSSAVVLAAVITSVGALVSTLIQTNTKALSSFDAANSGEPLGALYPALAELPPRTTQELVGFNQPTQFKATKAKQVALNEPARLRDGLDLPYGAPAIAEPPISQRLSWNVAKPAVAASAAPTVAASTPVSVSSPIVSPWYYLQQSQTAAATRSNKKFEWNSLAKLFRWPN
jgi:hypothetical protein